MQFCSRCTKCRPYLHIGESVLEEVLFSPSRGAIVGISVFASEFDALNSFVFQFSSYHHVMDIFGQLQLILVAGIYEHIISVRKYLIAKNFRNRILGYLPTLISWIFSSLKSARENTDQI